MTLKNSLSNNNEEFNNAEAPRAQAAEPKGPAGGIGIVELTVKIVKRHLWLPLLACLGFLMNMPVITALVWNYIDSYEIGFLQDTSTELLRGFNGGTMCIVIVGAVLASFTLFNYLHNRRQVDFYHSLPIRREQFFAANILAGLLVFLAPYLAAHILCVPLLAGSGMLQYIDMGAYVQNLLMHTLVYMLMFALGVLAMMLSGNRAGAAKVLVATYAICPLTALICDMLGSVFYNTYFSATLANPLVKLSVFGRYVAMCSDEGSFDGSLDILWQDWVLGVVLLIAALAAALLLYKRRKSECAGSTLAFGWQRPIFKYPYVIISGLVGACVFYLVSEESYIWLAFGLLLGTLLSAQVLEIFMAADFWAIKRGLRSAAVCVVLVAGIITVYAADLTGYDSWEAQAENLQEIYLPAEMLLPYEEKRYYYHDDITRDYYNTDPKVYSYYNFARGWVKISEPENLAAALQILQSEPVNYVNTFGSAYDKCENVWAGDQISPVQYVLAGGAKKMRTENFGDIRQNLDAYTVLLNSEEIRAQLYRLPEPSEEYTILLREVGDYTHPEEWFYNVLQTYYSDEEAALKVMDAWEREIRGMDAGQLITSPMVGVLYIENYKNLKADTNRFTFDWSATIELPVYPQMTDTIALLKQYYDGALFENPEGRGFRLVSVTELVPQNTELLTYPQSELPDMAEGAAEAPTPTSGAEATVQYETSQYVTDEVTLESINEFKSERVLTLPKDAAEIAEIYDKAVANSQVNMQKYYYAYRYTNMLVRYDFLYRSDEGYDIVVTRYSLPE